jgi:ferredoxin
MHDDLARAKVEEVPEEHEDCAREAAEDCPVEAIEIED